MKTLQVIWEYAFQDKRYPVLLYNMYGSEGHGPDRLKVDEMIKKDGFWLSAFKLLTK
jgi:hypothetical protein